MPNIYFAPPPRRDPYAFANRDAMMQVFDVVNKSKRENFETEFLEKYLSGETDFSALMSQDEPEGFLGKMWDAVNPKGTYRGGPGGLSPFTQRVLGQAMVPMLRDPLETEALQANIDYTKARGEYYGEYYSGERTGALPGWWNKATPEQRQGYLDRVGGQNININVPLSPEDQAILNKLKMDKATGRAGPGLSPSDKKALAEEMDTALDKARSGFFGRIGKPDYTEDSLFREWRQFNALNTFDNDNQKENVWAAWKAKVNKRNKDWFVDNEVDWDPTDPKWREEIGLKAPTEGYAQPKTPEAFEKTISMIKNEKQQELYFNKWKHLWPDNYE